MSFCSVKKGTTLKICRLCSRKVYRCVGQCVTEFGWGDEEVVVGGGGGEVKVCFRLFWCLFICLFV